MRVFWAKGFIVNFTNRGFRVAELQVNHYETYIFGYFDANINSLFRNIFAPFFNRLAELRVGLHADSTAGPSP
jgi:hypothetical protein